MMARTPTAIERKMFHLGVLCAAVAITSASILLYTGLKDGPPAQAVYGGAVVLFNAGLLRWLAMTWSRFERND